MKKMYLFILIVFMLLLPVTSAFAAVPILTETGQQIFIPYATVGSGWWSGLAVHNTAGSSMTFSVGVYKDNGDYVSGDTFTVAAFAMKVDTLENFLPGNTAPSARMSVLIRCSAGGAPTFQATLFLGNDEGGFGFQNYTSVDWVHPIFIGPIFPIPDPSLPIFIPKWPIGLLM
jgi:hypothetical protein